MIISTVAYAALQAETVEFWNYDRAPNVAAGTGEIQQIRAPAGYIFEVLGLALVVLAVPASAAREHWFFARTESEDMYYLGGWATFNQPLRYQYGVWEDADSRQEPGTEAAQINAIKGKRFDENNGLELEYFNNTDAIQTNDREYRIHVRIMKVAT